MSHDKLRTDDECENCGYTVDRVYCSKCGQKNDVTRQTFIYLITHFAEDLTHYDSSFWKTIKYLLFRPARLTQEYLSGKRQMYVPPVKLYIFISFVTFFILAILPDFGEKEKTHNSPDASHHEETIVRKPNINEKENVYFSGWKTEGEVTSVYNPISYTSVKEMDSIESLKPDSLRLSPFERKLAKKHIRLYAHNTPEQVGRKLFSSLPHNIPKAIFIYMPIFAFWLWLFHGKKRWYFFDHGIFTLHYFSFLLLGITFMSIIQSILSFFFREDNETNLMIVSIPAILILLWQIFYFYRSHRKMYSEGFVINFAKSTILFIINMVLIVFLMYGLMVYTFHNLH